MALFQKYDPRAEYVNPTISAMTDMGLIDYMFRLRMPHLHMGEQEDMASERKLEIRHFYLPIMFLSAGFAFAIISALAEKCVGKSMVKDFHGIN